MIVPSPVFLAGLIDTTTENVFQWERSLFYETRLYLTDRVEDRYPSVSALTYSIDEGFPVAPGNPKRT